MNAKIKICLKPWQPRKMQEKFKMKIAFRWKIVEGLWFEDSYIEMQWKVSQHMCSEPPPPQKTGSYKVSI